MSSIIISKEERWVTSLYVTIPFILFSDSCSKGKTGDTRRNANLQSCPFGRISGASPVAQHPIKSRHVTPLVTGI